ncbi:ATP-binding protein, partial [Corynebacterium striatum]
RNINPEQISRLAHGQWCHLGQNIVILGKSSVGKTYLAQALINVLSAGSWYRGYGSVVLPVSG